MSLDLEALGFSKEELQQRVVDAAVQRLFECTSLDDDGDEFIDASPFAGRLEAAVKSAIDNKVADLAEKHVLPLTENFIENLTLQQTNQWGEKRGEPVTFVEYLVQRAESYLREDVNYQGKTRGEDSYNWSKNQTRITWLVDQHLQYHIKIAMETAIKNANESLAAGIAETVKTQLGELSKKLKVEVKS